MTEDLTVKEVWVSTVRAGDADEARRRVQQYDYDVIDLDHAETVDSGIVEVDEGGARGARCLPPKRPAKPASCRSEHWWRGA